MNDGFGWGFYGFFLYATVWVTGYFIWAFRANRRDREKGRERH